MQTAQEATRKMDKLGRLRIPSEFAREMRLKKFQRCEMTIEYGRICIKKFNENNFMLNPYTGMVRYLDELDRICIPKEYLNLLKIRKGINVKLLLDEDKIIIFVAE